MVQESKKDSSLQVASQKTLEYGQVVFSTDNIFNRCHSRSKIGYPAESNPLQQLDVVGNFVSDLGAIIRSYKSEVARRPSRADAEPQEPQVGQSWAQSSGAGIHHLNSASQSTHSRVPNNHETASSRAGSIAGF